MKTLTLLRHAKSSWDHPELADIDRPLNKRGKRDAPIMGERLARAGISPELILTSPARRARKTASRVARALGYPADRIVVDPRIYAAAPAELMALIRGLDDRWSDVMLVGHNPTLTELANELTAADIDNVPTAGVVRIRFPVPSWSDIRPGAGELTLFDYPKRAVTPR